MFPLAGKSYPASSEELGRAIEGALAEVFTLAKSGQAVKVSGDDFPALKKLTINLDGAQVNATEPPDKPLAKGKRTEGIQVSQFEFSGHPIRYENSKVDLEVTARGVQLDFAKDKNGHPLLVLVDAQEGQAQANVSKDDLRTLVTAIASAAAKEQGVKIQDLEIDLTSAGKRSVAADVRVTARKAIVSGVVRLKGRADVDDDLNATISDLTCEGEGMVGKLSAEFLRGRLKAINGRKFPLMAFSLGDVTLRDVTVDVKRGLHVKARFGSE